MSPASGLDLHDPPFIPHTELGEVGGPPGRVPRWAVIGALVAIVAVAEASVAAGLYVPFVSPLIGLVAALGVPLVLIYRLAGRAAWLVGAERLAVTVAAAILTLMVTGLAGDVILPLLGVSRPLDTWPVLITGDLADAGLLALVYRDLPAHWRLPSLRVTGWRSYTSLGAAVLTVPLAAMGAVRLNNNAGDAMSLVGLALILAVFAVLVKWRDLTDSAVAPAAVYCVSLALLYMTSLRGWYTTGHDIQNEMMAFLRTAGQGRWTNSIHDGYNSCLSITILPTVLLRWTRVSDPYVYKVLFQPLYAICPVIVYCIARRITSRSLSLVATFFFVGFVSFMQDMPMINRQEIAFIFFSAALLVTFSTEQGRRWRWGWFAVMAVGMVLSHYSTSYFAGAAMFLMLGVRLLATRVLPRLSSRWRSVQTARPGGSLVAWPLVAFVLVLTTLWNGPVNGNASGLVSAVSNAFSSVVDHSNQTRSADTAYSVAAPGRGITQEGALKDLLQTEAKVITKNPSGFEAAPPPSASLTPLAPTELLPLTSLGHAVFQSESAAYSFNRDWRTISAWGLQILLVVGLFVVLFRRRYAATFASDAVYLGVGMILLLGAQVVLPNISNDYGVGRSFMQAMMILGPFMALGAAALAGMVASKWRIGLAFGLAGGIFASTSGLVPQLIGGYGPQLNLNNAGDYYDRFYVQASEVAGITWIDRSVVATSARYPAIQTDFDTFDQAKSIDPIRAFDDMYPSDIHKPAYVIVPYSAVVEGKVLETKDGYELWLEYPTGVIAAHKSLIYDNGQMQIYR